MNIKIIAKSLNFENLDDDMFAETFSKKQIKKDFLYEDAIANPLENLPEDYIWYLENYGCRTLRNMEYQVQIDKETTYIAAFEGLVAPSGACQKYRYHTCTGSYAYRLEDDEVYTLESKFLPISSENDGKMLVVDIQEKVGSIWQFPSKEDCSKHELNYQPSFVAASFTSFLTLVKLSQWSSYFKETLVQQGYKETEEVSNIWKKNILTAKELFYNCLDEYEKKKTLNFIEFKDISEFLKLLNTEPKFLTINEPRAVELFYLSFESNWKANTAIELEENIKKIQKLKSNLNIKREKCTVEILEQHTNTSKAYIGTDHHFQKTTLKSIINGLQSEEDFVFYKNPNTQLLSLVKRVEIRIEDMRIKGIGTFEYDDSWSSKKTIKTKWSKIPATIYLNPLVEDFIEEYYAFIRQTINDATFKEKIEQFIFDHYQKNDYPAFDDMSKTDKDFFEASYPKISTPNEIWKVLGDEFDIRFIDNQTFVLLFEYGPDDEHGLTITFVNGKFQIG